MNDNFYAAPVYAINKHYKVTIQRRHIHEIVKIRMLNKLGQLIYSRLILGQLFYLRVSRDT